MNSQQNLGQEVTLRQIIGSNRFVSKEDSSFLKVRVIFARKTTVSQKNKTAPVQPQKETVQQKIGQIIFADDENHIEGVFNIGKAHHYKNTINKLIKLTGQVIVLRNFAVEKRPSGDFYQTLLKKPTKRLRLSGCSKDFDVYKNDESTDKILKHIPFHFTPMEDIDKVTVKKGDFIDVIAFCEKYEDTEGASSKIKYRKALFHSTRSTKSNEGCSYEIAGFDNRKEIKCIGAVYAMMNLKVTTFSKEEHKSLKITPSTIIIKLELAARNRTPQSLDVLPPNCRDQPYVKSLLPKPRTQKNTAAQSVQTRIPLQQLG